MQGSVTKRHFEIVQPRRLSKTKLFNRLVGGVPDTWRFADGTLTASEHRMRLNHVLRDTAFVLDSHCSERKLVRGVGSLGGRPLEVDLRGFFLRQKWPEFLQFDFSAMDAPEKFPLVKEVAAEYLSREYGGSVWFHRDYHNDVAYDNSAWCGIKPTVWYAGKPKDGEEWGPQPARITVAWDSQFKGTQEHVDSIVEICQELGFPEITPVLWQEQKLITAA